MKTIKRLFITQNNKLNLVRVLVKNLMKTMMKTQMKNKKTQHLLVRKTKKSQRRLNLIQIKVEMFNMIRRGLLKVKKRKNLQNRIKRIKVQKSNKKIRALKIKRKRKEHKVTRTVLLSLVDLNSSCLRGKRESSFTNLSTG